MSQGKLCHLCVKISEENRCLYNEDGDENENYELVMEYFDPEFLFRGKELELTTVCLSCWKQIYEFDNFQESIYRAQNNLLDNSKDFLILEIGSPENGNSNELIENLGINIKTEQEFLSEDEGVVNFENKYEPIEAASETPSKEIYGTSEKNSTYLLPKLEIMDVYSNDDTSDDGLSKEYYEQNVSYLNDDSIESDDSMDITPAEAHVEGISSKDSRTSKCQVLSPKETDDLLAQLKQYLHCELCSSKCTTYSLLRKHFQLKHPNEKCYVTCCGRIFYHRRRLQDHIRTHKRIGKPWYENIMEDVEMDELVAHANFADQAKECLKCVVCAEVSLTYSLLRQHFHVKHPQEKFYLLCCKRKFSLRWSIDNHVRLHIDPNVFKCDLCPKKFTEGRRLHAHKRNLHSDINDEAMKVSSKKKSKKKNLTSIEVKI